MMFRFGIDDIHGVHEILVNIADRAVDRVGHEQELRFGGLADRNERRGDGVFRAAPRFVIGMNDKLAGVQASGGDLVGQGMEKARHACDIFRTAAFEITGIDILVGQQVQMDVVSPRGRRQGVQIVQPGIEVVEYRRGVIRAVRISRSAGGFKRLGIDPVGLYTIITQD